MNLACRFVMGASLIGFGSCSLFREGKPADETPRGEESCSAPVPEAGSGDKEQAVSGENVSAAADPVQDTPVSSSSAVNDDRGGVTHASEAIRLSPAPAQEDEEELPEAGQPAPAVELRGMRSPRLPSALPMSLDGKVRN
ncbi:MAG: hypothetical protein LUG84_00375 [Akkermansiaceae bacterium]|nr:hypothetical protein [Akkermansiaceae bacterium]